MKKRKLNFSKKILDFILLYIRVVIGSIMLSHGIPKLVNLIEGKIQFYNFMGLGETTSLLLTVISEVFASIFLILGFFTRISSFLLAFTMFVAAFVVNFNNSFSSKEMAILYFIFYSICMIMGGGKFSIDQFVKKK